MSSTTDALNGLQNKQMAEINVKKWEVLSYITKKVNNLNGNDPHSNLRKSRFSGWSSESC